MNRGKEKSGIDIKEGIELKEAKEVKEVKQCIFIKGFNEVKL